MATAGWQLKTGLKLGLATTVLAVLAACGSSSSTPPASDNGYLLTVKINQSDSQQAVAQTFGGEAISWHPDAGFAILKMSSQAVAQLTSRGVSLQGTTLSTNTSTAAPEVSASGWNVWGGGWNTWAGGWNTWAGGWNTWAGGVSSIPTVPAENRYAFQQVSLPEAQVLVNKYGEGTKIAVIDSGLDLAHPIFSGRLAPSTEWKDFVDGDTTPQDVSGGTGYGHGTVVAGIIAQFAPKATILPIRVLGADGGGDVNKVISGIDWAIQKGANIINLSLGTTTDVAALKTEIAYATSLGIYVVTSAGNDGSTTALTYPAEYATTISGSQYLISVGSSDSTSVLSSFSNRDLALEMVARGEGIFSAYPGNQIAYANGTSFAAPQVSGALAVARSNTASSNWSNLGNILINSAWTMQNSGNARFLSMVGLIRSLPGFVATRNILFVVGNTTLSAGDARVYNRLSWLGYAITTKTGAAATTADATGKNLVIISSSVNPTDVNTKFKSVTTPVLTWEAQLYDDMAMVSATAGNFGTTTAQNALAFSSANSSHPLAGAMYLYFNLWAGTAFPVASTVSWGKPPSSATVIATLPSDSTKAVIFGYPAGTTMVGMSAPGRRVAFMVDDSSSQYVDTYWATQWLFDSAVTWAVSGN